MSLTKSSIEFGMLQLPLRTRLVSEREAQSLRERAREVRERYESKGWFLVEGEKGESDEHTR